MSLTKMSSTEVVSASVDNTIRVWDLNNLQEENVLQGVKAHFSVDYSPHKKVFCSTWTVSDRFSYSQQVAQIDMLGYGMPELRQEKVSGLTDQRN